MYIGLEQGSLLRTNYSRILWYSYLVARHSQPSIPCVGCGWLVGRLVCIGLLQWWRVGLGFVSLGTAGKCKRRPGWSTVRRPRLLVPSFGFQPHPRVDGRTHRGLLWWFRAWPGVVRKDIVWRSFFSCCPREPGPSRPPSSFCGNAIGMEYFSDDKNCIPGLFSCACILFRNYYL